MDRMTNTTENITSKVLHNTLNTMVKSIFLIVHKEIFFKNTATGKLEIKALTLAGNTGKTGNAQV